MLIAFNKPYGVLSQFTSQGGKPTLADFIALPRVYPAGRLDFDSEGLLLLTDEGATQHRIADPSRRLGKRYYAQVEGIPDAAALGRFGDGLVIGEGAAAFRALPALASVIRAPDLPPRSPPIRHRAGIPTSWLEVRIHEGKHRQVRRMTAAVGHPTLRLVRVAIGPFDLFALGLAPGMWSEVDRARLAVAATVAEEMRGPTRGGTPR